MFILLIVVAAVVGELLLAVVVGTLLRGRSAAQSLAMPLVPSDASSLLSTFAGADTAVGHATA